MARRVPGRLRARAGRHGGVSEPGLAGVHHTGVAGTTGTGGAGRRAGPARAAVDRNVVPPGRLVPDPAEPVAQARARAAGAQVLAPVRVEHHGRAAEDGPEGRVQRAEGRPEGRERPVRPVPVRHAAGEHVQHVRRRRDRRPSSRGDVSRVAATDGPRGNAGRTPQAPPEATRRLRRPAAVQPVLASAAQFAPKTGQAAGHAQAQIRQAVPVPGPAQSHRNDRILGSVQPEAVTVNVVSGYRSLEFRSHVFRLFNIHYYYYYHHYCDCQCRASTEELYPDKLSNGNPVSSR